MLCFSFVTVSVMWLDTMRCAYSKMWKY